MHIFGSDVQRSSANTFISILEIKRKIGRQIGYKYPCKKKNVFWYPIIPKRKHFIEKIVVDKMATH